MNDLLHPNVDYYKEFLRSSSTFRKATLELSGGNARAKYAVTVGYTGSSGLEKVGDRSDLNRVNARGNLDIRITDFLSASADVAARVEKRIGELKMVAGCLAKYRRSVPMNILL